MMTTSIDGKLSLAAAASSMQVEVAPVSIRANPRSAAGSDPLGQKLLRDILFDADGNLHDRASLLERTRGGIWFPLGS